jgi:hypothetical protein
MQQGSPNPNRPVPLKLPGIIIGCIALAALAGCRTPSYLPLGAKLVGGGLQINYSPPVDGTVILVERVSGKIIATESVDRGDRPGFVFSSASTPNWERIMAGYFPDPASPTSFLLPTNAVFELYLVPTK